MADNNLEFFIREDLEELIRSDAVRKPKMTTWVYFDPLSPEPLSLVWEKDGSQPLMEDYEGSRYLTFSHTLRKMVVDTTLLGEQDSDSEEVVFQFVRHALTDCVARGTKEYLIVFADHGGGAIGFGGDETIRRRKLIARNNVLVSALKRALAAVEGAPAVFDVIGFEACLMMAFGSLDDFDSSITKYVLASESLIWGSAWPFDTLTKVDSALELAQEIYENFLMDDPNSNTIAIVDTTKFELFRDSFEQLSAELGSLLDAGDDPGISAAVEQAQKEAVNFGFSFPLIDIGSFLSNLQDICNPFPESMLAALLFIAAFMYEDMFVVAGFAENALEGTGMHVLFPFREDYQYQFESLDPLLFEDPATATLTAPKWLSFMKSFFSDQTTLYGPSAVCSSIGGFPFIAMDPTLVPSAPTPSPPTTPGAPPPPTILPVFPPVQPPIPPDLFLDEELSMTADGRFLVEAIITPTVSASVQFGIRLDLLGDSVYGGRVATTYDGLILMASWDDIFYLIGDGSGPGHLFYVEDRGGGAKIGSVMYFPPDTITADADVQKISVEEAETLGGTYASISFLDSSSDEGIEFSLFATSSNGLTISEVIPSNGGFIVPIVQTGAFPYEAVLGGLLDEVILPWSSAVELTRQSSEQVTAGFASSSAIISLAASEGLGRSQEVVFIAA